MKFAVLALLATVVSGVTLHQKAAIKAKSTHTLRNRMKAMHKNMIHNSAKDFDIPESWEECLQKADFDNSGELDFGEIQVAIEAGLGRDLTEEELGGLSALFEAVDGDTSGTISEAEFDAAVEAGEEGEGEE